MEMKSKNAILVKQKCFIILFIIMLSKAKIRLIQSLQYKKFRKAHALFVVEGLKSIQEFIHAGWEIDTLYTTEIFRISNSYTSLHFIFLGILFNLVKAISVVYKLLISL